MSIHLVRRIDRGCGGKVRHETSGNARAHAKALNIKTSSAVHAYQCEFCGGWHVGHTKRRNDNKRFKH